MKKKLTIKTDGAIGLFFMVLFTALSYVDHSIAAFFVFAYSLFLILIMGIGLAGILTALFIIVYNAGENATVTNNNPTKLGFMFYLGITIQTLFWYSVFVNTSVALAVVGVTMLILVLLGTLLTVKLANDFLETKKLTNQ